MKKHSNCDLGSVKIVLSEGKAHADELKRQLNPISREACIVLIETLINSYDNALALISGDSCNNNSSNSDEDFPKRRGETKNSFKNRKLRVSTKRKRERREQVRVRSEKGFEGLMNDGHNWRKYGQKVILNANHPRAYYRCTHRHTQSCLATKQVQRADDDPSIFQVVYVGKHTCAQENIKNSLFEESPKETSMIYEAEEAAAAKEEAGEDLKIESFFREDDGYLSASRYLVDDFSMGRISESDFDEMFSSPTRVGDFVFGDLDPHVIDSYW